MIISAQALLLLLIALPLGAHASQPESLTSITFADGNRDSKNAVDIGPPGPSQGDLFIFDQPLMNAELQDIGNNSGYCINTLPAVHSQCQWTLTFTDAAARPRAALWLPGKSMKSAYRWWPLLAARVNTPGLAVK